MKKTLLILTVLIFSCKTKENRELDLTGYSNFKESQIENYQLSKVTDELFYDLRVGFTESQVESWKTKLISKNIGFINDKKVFYINIPDEYSESESTTLSVSCFYKNDSLVSTKLFFGGNGSNSNFYQLKRKIEDKYGSAIAEYESNEVKKTILGEIYYPHNNHYLFWLNNNILIELEETEYGRDEEYYMTIDYTYLPFEKEIIQSVRKDEEESKVKRQQEKNKIERENRETLEEMF